MPGCPMSKRRAAAKQAAVTKQVQREISQTSLERDSDLLGQIEDFLVNEFGVDEREQMSDAECREMLVYIMDDLLEKRRKP